MGSVLKGTNSGGIAKEKRVLYIVYGTRFANPEAMKITDWPVHLLTIFMNDSDK